MLNIRTITISKSIGYQKVEVTADLDCNDDYQAGIDLLQKLTNEALKNAIKQANQLIPQTPELPNQTIKQEPEKPKELTPAQIKFSRSLIEQGKLPRTFNPLSVNAYYEFRAAAGDSENYKRINND